MNALDLDEEFLRTNKVDKWFDSANAQMLKDIKQVYIDGKTIFATEVELKSPSNLNFNRIEGNSLIINYQIMPLLGEKKGLVLVMVKKF